jgi:hypothetical protein
VQTINPVELRQRSQWLAFAVSFAIVAVTLGLTLFWPQGDFIFGDSESGRLFSLLGDYQSPQLCRECHVEQFDSWSHTTHANALFDPIFRTYLEQAEQPGECLACHTTGYDTDTGQFVLAGVTCEACHGPYRPQHPEESMTIARSPEFCGDCHRTTLAEWEMSRHGVADIRCIDCHEVHSQQAHAAATTNTLCADCHRLDIEDARHQAHNDAGILCIECHLDRPDEIPVNGHMLTAHTFTATRENCSDCHADE